VPHEDASSAVFGPGFAGGGHGGIGRRRLLEPFSICTADFQATMTGIASTMRARLGF